jgi:hypothetical protein
VLAGGVAFSIAVAAAAAAAEGVSDAAKVGGGGGVKGASVAADWSRVSCKSL